MRSFDISISLESTKPWLDSWVAFLNEAVNLWWLSAMDDMDYSNWYGIESRFQVGMKSATPGFYSASTW